MIQGKAPWCFLHPHNPDFTVKNYQEYLKVLLNGVLPENKNMDLYVNSNRSFLEDSCFSERTMCFSSDYSRSLWEQRYGLVDQTKGL